MICKCLFYILHSKCGEINHQPIRFLFIKEPRNFLEDENRSSSVNIDCTFGDTFDSCNVCDAVKYTHEYYRLIEVFSCDCLCQGILFDLKDLTEIKSVRVIEPRFSIKGMPWINSYHSLRQNKFNVKFSLYLKCTFGLYFQSD